MEFVLFFFLLALFAYQQDRLSRLQRRIDTMERAAAEREPQAR
ncbi:MAG TPA: hypothetical protein VFF91_07755 [Pseudoxanthomonas sp.]|nr:hypothetical protein [Pseudoxanthomonas sp.]